jgi:hypothetical protein
MIPGKKNLLSIVNKQVTIVYGLVQPFLAEQLFPDLQQIMQAGCVCMCNISLTNPYLHPQNN